MSRLFELLRVALQHQLVNYAWQGERLREESTSVAPGCNGSGWLNNSCMA